MSGMMRRVYEALLDVLPTGQVVLLADMAVSKPLLNLGASVAVTGIAALSGAALFRKKDLK